MAITMPTGRLLLPFLFFFILYHTCFSCKGVFAGKSNVTAKIPRPMIGFGKEKISHLHFYFHDVLSGRNPSAIQVARADTTSKFLTLFGAVYMIDDPLTEGPDPKSKLFGRAQGFYASASQTDLGLLMAMNFAFVEGKYKGSTLTILGRNPVLNPVREMPIIGGSGLFRLARGYVLAKTHLFDLKTGDAVVEYNVYVTHY
ncbi:hypothetical protein AMTRI_Chr05g60660 [Amborella trichopoda]